MASRDMPASLCTKGVTGNKPLHTLRKLYGSALADLHGLHAASSGLRHWYSFALPNTL
jgi:hypothetical protein